MCTPIFMQQSEHEVTYIPFEYTVYYVHYILSVSIRSILHIGSSVLLKTYPDWYIFNAYSGA